MPNCRACKAPIRFAMSSTGSTIPVDAEPALDGKGNLILFTDGTGKLCARTATERDRQAIRPRHKSHFATCTKPEQFRKRERKP